MLYENGTFLILLHNINKQLKYQYRKKQQNQENTIATAVLPSWTVAFIGQNVPIINKYRISYD